MCLSASASDGINAMLRKICKRMKTPFRHTKQPHSLGVRFICKTPETYLTTVLYGACIPPVFQVVWNLENGGVQSIEIPF
jgi:hypothetical protein